MLFVLSMSSVNASTNPQTDVNTSINEQEERRTKSNFALTKYEFMQNAKISAEKEFYDTTSTAIMAELNQIAKLAEQNSIDSKNEKIQNAVAVVSAETKEVPNVNYITTNSVVSLQELTEALNDLKEVTAEYTVVENDAVEVTTGNGIEPLVSTDRVDSNYVGRAIELTADNRSKLESLIMEEAGGEGFIGAALVAQTIHDTMISEDCYDVMAIKKKYQYDGGVEDKPNQNVIDAVAFIFDDGGVAVQHSLRYFYAPARVTSSFHEGCMFIVEYGGHRFFDNWE